MQHKKNVATAQLWPNASKVKERWVLLQGGRVLTSDCPSQCFGGVGQWVGDGGDVLDRSQRPEGQSSSTREENSRGGGKGCFGLRLRREKGGGVDQGIAEGKPPGEGSAPP